MAGIAGIGGCRGGLLEGFVPAMGLLLWLGSAARRGRRGRYGGEGIQKGFVAGPGPGLAAGLFVEVVAMRQLAPNHAGDDTLLHGRLDQRMGMAG